VFWDNIIHAQLLNVADDGFSYLKTKNDRQLHLESIAKIHSGTHILLYYACNCKEYDLRVLFVADLLWLILPTVRRSSVGSFVEIHFFY
jgi:hypothetical protein